MVTSSNQNLLKKLIVTSTSTNRIKLHKPPTSIDQSPHSHNYNLSPFPSPRTTISNFTTMRPHETQPRPNHVTTISNRSTKKIHVNQQTRFQGCKSKPPKNKEDVLPSFSAESPSKCATLRVILADGGRSVVVLHGACSPAALSKLLETNWASCSILAEKTRATTRLSRRPRRRGREHRRGCTKVAGRW